MFNSDYDIIIELKQLILTFVFSMLFYYIKTLIKFILDYICIIT